MVLRRPPKRAIGGICILGFSFVKYMVYKGLSEEARAEECYSTLGEDNANEAGSPMRIWRIKSSPDAVSAAWSLHKKIPLNHVLKSSGACRMDLNSCFSHSGSIYSKLYCRFVYLPIIHPEQYLLAWITSVCLSGLLLSLRCAKLLMGYHSLPSSSLLLWPQIGGPNQHWVADQGLSGVNEGWVKAYSFLTAQLNKLSLPTASKLLK